MSILHKKHQALSVLSMFKKSQPDPEGPLTHHAYPQLLLQPHPCSCELCLGNGPTQHKKRKLKPGNKEMESSLLQILHHLTPAPERPMYIPIPETVSNQIIYYSQNDHIQSQIPRQLVQSVQNQSINNEYRLLWNNGEVERITNNELTQIMMSGSWNEVTYVQKCFTGKMKTISFQRDNDKRYVPSEVKSYKESVLFNKEKEDPLYKNKLMERLGRGSKVILNMKDMSKLNLKKRAFEEVCRTLKGVTHHNLHWVTEQEEAEFIQRMRERVHTGGESFFNYICWKIVAYLELKKLIWLEKFEADFESNSEGRWFLVDIRGLKMHSLDVAHDKDNVENRNIITNYYKKQKIKLLDQVKNNVVEQNEQIRDMISYCLYKNYKIMLNMQRSFKINHPKECFNQFFFHKMFPDVKVTLKQLLNFDFHKIKEAIITNFESLKEKRTQKISLNLDQEPRVKFPKIFQKAQSCRNISYQNNSVTQISRQESSYLMPPTNQQSYRILKNVDDSYLSNINQTSIQSLTTRNEY